MLCKLCGTDRSFGQARCGGCEEASHSAEDVVLEPATQLLEVLIPLMGVGKSEGFPLDALMGFVGACFGSANAEVRAAAIRVTMLVRPLLSYPAMPCNSLVTQSLTRRPGSPAVGPDTSLTCPPSDTWGPFACDVSRPTVPVIFLKQTH